MKIRTEESAPNLMELKPNRNLLDPKFNGYKLSLETSPTYAVNLETEVDRVYPTAEQYSLQHIKLFATYNYIIPDPWNTTIVYVIDKHWHVLKLEIDVDSGAFSPAFQVWSIPSTDAKVAGRFNATLIFPDKSFGVLADGCGNLYILKTNDRKVSSEWNVVFSRQLFSTKKWQQFMLLDATSYQKDDSSGVDALLCRIDEKSDWEEILGRENNPNVPEYNFVSAIEWITLNKDGNNEWDITDTNTVVGRSGFNYCSIERNGEALYLASENEYFFKDDSEQVKLLESCNASSDEGNADLKQFAYLWMQNNEEITLWIKLPKNATNDQIAIDVGIQKIRVYFKEWLLVDGLLQHKVVKDDFKWSINQAEDITAMPVQTRLSHLKYLEIVLKKGEKNVTWDDNLITDESSGKLLDDVPADGEIYVLLTDLCADRWGEAKDSTCLDSQLEECDSFPAFTSCLMRMNRIEKKITDKVSLNSHQWLFNVRIDGEKVPAVCVRHDVDGVVWQPDINVPETKEPLEHGNSSHHSWKMEHVGTFSAFGYVLASKQQRKFTISPPDLSYVAVCDTKKHVYVYDQPKPIENTLRNRKTGESISHVAKQRIISVDPPEEILGAHASNNFVFTLTAKRLSAFRVTPLEDP